MKDLSCGKAIVLAIATSLTQVTDAATIFESAVLGETGILRDDVGMAIVPGAGITHSHPVGVRFELHKPTRIGQIGGHFVGPFSTERTIFGALGQLDSPQNFPDSEDFSTHDVLNETLNDLPLEAADVYGDINLALEPGWYTVIFGGGFRGQGLFGARGHGSAVANNTPSDNGGFFQYNPSLGWVNIPYDTDIETDIDINRVRFAVGGAIVTEPVTIQDGLIALLAASIWCRRSSCPGRD